MKKAVMYCGCNIPIALGCGCRIGIAHGVRMCKKHREEWKNLPTLAEKKVYVDKMLESWRI